MGVLLHENVIPVHPQSVILATSFVCFGVALALVSFYRSQQAFADKLVLGIELAIPLTATAIVLFLKIAIQGLH